MGFISPFPQRKGEGDERFYTRLRLSRWEFPIFNYGAPGFGKTYKDAVHKGRWGMQIGMWGECLARKENFVEVDESRVDAYGIPTLKINCSWSDNELKMFEDGRDQAMEMLKAAGTEEIRKSGRPSVPGHCIHEIGTARMGNDRKRASLTSTRRLTTCRTCFAQMARCGSRVAARTRLLP